MRTLDETAAAILEPPKGMLVLDEYAEALVGPGRAQRFTDAVLRTDGLSEHVSAVLLTTEVFAALSPTGTSPLIGVRATTPDMNLADLIAGGVSFVEWRENLSPLDVPRGAVHVGVQALARGAAATQAAGVLPVLTIAMPDLGASSITVTQAVTTNALLALRNELARTGVDPQHLLIRINMIVPGLSNPAPATAGQVARLTRALLEKGVPPKTPGVLLLSGGQPLEQVCAYLEAIASDHPWGVTFGFSRPLLATVVEAWGDSEDDNACQRVLLQNCRRAGDSVAAALVTGGTSS